MSKLMPWSAWLLALVPCAIGCSDPGDVATDQTGQAVQSPAPPPGVTKVSRAVRDEGRAAAPAACAAGASNCCGGQVCDEDQQCCDALNPDGTCHAQCMTTRYCPAFPCRVPE